MILDIDLIKLKRMFCIDSALATVSKLLNRNYEMMFIRMLGFGFSFGQEKENNNIGKNIIYECKDTDIFEMYEKYHGIRVISKKISGQKNISPEIFNQLNHNMPVAMNINAKLCSWEKNDDVDVIFLLIIGYDENQFSCIDIHEGSREIKHLPYKNINEHCSFYDDYEYFLFEVVKEEENNISVNSVINEMKSLKYFKKDTHLEIVEFAHCIEKNLDFNIEKSGCDNPYFMPIFFGISNIIRARNLISISFKYIYKLTHDKRADKIHTLFSILDQEWQFIWNMLQKIYFIGEIEENNKEIMLKLKKKVGDRLRTIALAEKNIINIFCSNNFEIGIDYRIADNSKIDLSHREVQQYSIEEYCNNKAFALSINNYDADLTGRKEYFILDDVNIEKNIKVIGGQIEIQIVKDKFDNISCDGQALNISGKYQKLFIIACSEWGDSMEYMDIIYLNGNTSKYLLKIKDWYDINDPNEQCIFVGNAIDHMGRGGERGLFLYSYSMNYKYDISQIILPKNKNLHIFGIYFLK